jgi:hypothetical protein
MGTQVVLVKGEVAPVLSYTSLCNVNNFDLLFTR